LDLFGFIWIYLDLFGFIWIYLDLFGFIHFYLDLFIFIWILFQFYFVSIHSNTPICKTHFRVIYFPKYFCNCYELQKYLFFIIHFIIRVMIL